jgi:orotate phosphoribosyltransferase-like protein
MILKLWKKIISSIPIEIEWSTLTEIKSRLQVKSTVKNNKIFTYHSKKIDFIIGFIIGSILFLIFIFRKK